MQNNQAIFESLFSRNFSDTDNISFLKAITDQHPYFSPAQFFLLQKTDEAADTYSKQAAKTNILFNNAHWLYFQLKQTSPLHKNEFTFQQDGTAQKMQEAIVPGNDLPDDTDSVAATSGSDEEMEPLRIELKIPEQKSNLDESLLFEPMHVVDYFASQGIKLSE